MTNSLNIERSDTLLRAPKVLLHDHLDGGLRPATIVELAARDGLRRAAHDRRRASWPPGSSSRPTRARWSATWRRSPTRSGSCRPPRRWPGSPRSAPRTWPPTAWSTPRCATRPSSTSRAGSTSPRSSRRSTRASARASGRAAAAGHRIRVGALLTAMRHAARSTEIAELAVRYRDKGVVGFDIAGAEAGYPPTRHLDAFEYLQRENTHFTIHAGEGFGLPSIWQAIQWCGADRLGHGVRIIDDIERRRRRRVELGRLAAYVRDKRIPLEMCPTSNVQTGAAKSIAEHPIGLLRRLLLPGDGQHRQPADERHDDDAGVREAGRRVRLRPARHPVVHRQRDEVGVPARSTSGSRSSTTSSSPATPRSRAPPDPSESTTLGRCSTASTCLHAC